MNFVRKGLKSGSWFLFIIRSYSQINDDEPEQCYATDSTSHEPLDEISNTIKK